MRLLQLCLGQSMRADDHRAGLAVGDVVHFPEPSRFQLAVTVRLWTTSPRMNTSFSSASACRVMLMARFTPKQNPTSDAVRTFILPLLFRPSGAQVFRRSGVQVFRRYSGEARSQRLNT